jgi:phosphonate transport system substrate-binding protein
LRASAALMVLLASILALAQAPPPKPLAGTLRFGVVSFYNPRLMYLKYQPLVDYLSRRTPWRFELDLSSTYNETIDRLCSGDTQIAYVGPLSYLRARQACGARVVARLNTGNRDTYTSYIMVRSESPYRTLADLRGRDFGFGARLSTSSHLVPRALLEDAGLRPGRDIGCRYFGHHERAARAVLLGEVAACGVRDLIGDQFARRGLRVLARSRPMPNFPLAVGPNPPEGLPRAILEALVEAPRRNPEIAREMAAWDAELSSGFAAGDATAYAPVLELALRVFGQHALTSAPEGFVCAPALGTPGSERE